MRAAERGGGQHLALPAHICPCLQLVKKCNEGAHTMERTEQMYTLHMQLDFGKVKVGAALAPDHCPPTPLSLLPSSEVRVPLQA